jgi:hypothetical protein
MRTRNRQPRSSARRLRLVLACSGALSLLISGAPARAAEASSAKPATAKTATAKTATTKTATAKTATAKPTATKPTRVAKKKKKKGTPTADAAAKEPKHRRVNASPAYLVVDDNAHLINESAPHVAAFPAETKQAYEKAFAENRRGQLVDAEKAARAEKSPDRWRTVLFMLTGLNDNGDSEACFWRVLSFYRLGEIDRARAVRAVCELPVKDSSALNAEDALVSRTPAMGTGAHEDQFTATTPVAADAPDAAPAPPPPVAPYTGPSPQRVQ